MSSVSAISDVTSLWSTTGTSGTSSTKSTADTYADLVSGLQTGGTGGSSSGSGSGDSSDTVTITKMMPDGSLLIMVMKGEQVISEQKVSSGMSANAGSQQNLLAANAAQSPVAQSTSQLLDRFNDTSASTSMLEGSLFTASV